MAKKIVKKPKAGPALPVSKEPDIIETHLSEEISIPTNPIKEEENG